MVWGTSTVAEVVSEPLQEAGAVIAGLPSGPLSIPQVVTLTAPLPPPSVQSAPPAVLLFLGGSKAPVDPRASALSLEGEVIVVENEPPQWDGKDLETFLAWEKIYATTLFSALELYGKPLLRAAVITREEYHLLFYYLESVSEASEALTERMRKYIDSGLLINESRKDDTDTLVENVDTLEDDDTKSLLTELINEGVLTRKDVDNSSVITSSEYAAQSDVNRKLDDTDNCSSVSSIGVSLRKIFVDIPVDNNDPDVDGSVMENENESVSLRNSRQCCVDHRISADASENVWANVRWDFLNPSDYGYDQIPSVKRSRSESAITPTANRRRNEEIYETLRDDAESCGSMTPYESIEDLYDCIKNSSYMSAAAVESSPSTESQSEPQYPDYDEKSIATRQSSASSDKSGASSAFPFSKCGSSDSTTYTSCESTSGISTFAPKCSAEIIKSRELPTPPTAGEVSESAILLKQLFMGELVDVYSEYLAAYPHARALLRRKARRDDHFAALADIRRGAAKYSIADYLELPFNDNGNFGVNGPGTSGSPLGPCARCKAAHLVVGVTVHGEALTMGKGREGVISCSG
ncbi:hypothetical protein RR46_05625 [Papilio xuthus]|uniref:Uncharacterized protein n=1 Tax=Papilio xuthus TaxID=66420 RepID=A0A194PVI9_PAPXU|nr:hypothetical protein RR46_05625 [Papilio xuthus]